MARKSQNKLGKALWVTIWLSFSVAGGVLFAFGLNDWFKDKTFENFIPVIIGFLITFVTIYLGQFRTETSVAFGKRKLK